ncbi:hypothetical protein ASE85_01575 [Sphingobium sp. Leaf26]|nr:hypothetical protein ASE85_01575 [Sphingobium sp. Leaf26]
MQIWNFAYFIRLWRQQLPIEMLINLTVDLFDDFVIRLDGPTLATCVTFCNVLLRNIANEFRTINFFGIEN